MPRPTPDLRGKVFGRLTALEPTAGRDPGGLVLWRCRCECGRRPLVAGANLTRGRTRSCGCLQTETRRAAGGRTVDAYDLTGQTFGRLRVLSLERVYKGGHRLWLCRCDCGTERIVRATKLLTAKITDCGQH